MNKESSLSAFGDEGRSITNAQKGFPISYLLKGESGRKEEFDKERESIIAQRIKDAENDDNLIDDEDLDFYLSELEKMED